MQEPVCAICGITGFGNGGNHLQFKVIDPKEIAYNRSLEEFPIPGGTPRGFRYFCGEHIKTAEKYDHLPYKEAVDLIKAEISEIERFEVENENKQFSGSLSVKLGSKIKEFFKRYSK